MHADRLRCYVYKYVPGMLLISVVRSKTAEEEETKRDAIYSDCACGRQANNSGIVG